MSLPEGLVVQSVGGFQTVLAPDGGTYQCTARGRLKRDLGEIIVGDRVSFSAGPAGTVIETVLPRRNQLVRPLVANVDQALLVFALRSPEPGLLLMDRFLVALMAAGLPVTLCLNKADLVKERAARELAAYYEGLGLATVVTSALARRGRNKMLARLYGRTTVLCGPSGVGKSALLNMICPGAKLVTGEVSEKIQRGRHTTRMANLIPIGRGGFVVDTPGYAQVDLGNLTPRHLAGCFPELSEYEGQCRYQGCLHLSEPGCAVKDALAEGRLPVKRYEHYCLFQGEIKGRAGKFRHQTDR